MDSARGDAFLKRVLFVCLGNICRSPTAEGVLRARAAAAGVALQVDSAGTAGYNDGAPPDARAIAHARRRGIDLSGLRARQLQAEDFERFDHVLVMDRANLAAAARLCPAHRRERLQLFMAFAPAQGDEVPDPYYGEAADFERVLDLCEAAADGLLARLR